MKKLLIVCLMLVCALLITACGQKKQEQAPKAEPATAVFNTSMGDFEVKLATDYAPETSKNFITLAEKGFYNGLIFHRVIPGFMIQGGGFTADGQHKETDSIKGEFDGNGVTNPLKHTRGVLSMARTMFPNSASSQFFIMHKAATHLDGSYAAFGKIIEGMDVVNKIAETETDFRDRPLDEQEIKSMTVDTFGVEYPEPEKC